MRANSTHTLGVTLALGAGLALSGCDKAARPTLPGGPKPAFDTARLDASINKRFGGVGTCMVIADTATGKAIYRYGDHAQCGYRLPPCSTFKVANTLIGLDAGAITPTTVMKWDGKPKMLKSWERDADLTTAFRESIVWWFQNLARKIGAPTYAERLKAFDYGNEDVSGAVDGFWFGPPQGSLAISTFEQVEFLGRLYRDKLPVKADSAATVKAIMIDETRGDATMSGKTGTCPTNAEKSRQVGWWIGRLKSPDKDYVFAASIENANDATLPGREMQTRVKSAFADAGVWPAN